MNCDSVCSWDHPGRATKDVVTGLQVAEPRKDKYIKVRSEPIGLITICLRFGTLPVKAPEHMQTDTGIKVVDRGKPNACDTASPINHREVKVPWRRRSTKEQRWKHVSDSSRSPRKTDCCLHSRLTPDIPRATDCDIDCDIQVGHCGWVGEAGYQ
jgi:hypothetical protein